MNDCAYCRDRARTPCTCTRDCKTQNSPIGDCPRAHPVPETQTIQLNADGPLADEVSRQLAYAIRRAREGGTTKLLDGDMCIAQITPSPVGPLFAYAREHGMVNRVIAELGPDGLSDYAKQDVAATQRIATDLGLPPISEPVKKPHSEFRAELERLINRYSVENGSNTPDYILADYLIACLVAFERITQSRDEWYGVHLEPGGSFFGATEGDS